MTPPDKPKFKTKKKGERILDNRYLPEPRTEKPFEMITPAEMNAAWERFWNQECRSHLKPPSGNLKDSNWIFGSGPKAGRPRRRSVDTEEPTE